MPPEAVRMKGECCRTAETNGQNRGQCGCQQRQENRFHDVRAIQYPAKPLQRISWGWKGILTFFDVERIDGNHKNRELNESQQGKNHDFEPRWSAVVMGAFRAHQKPPVSWPATAMH